MLLDEINDFYFVMGTLHVVLWLRKKVIIGVLFLQAIDHLGNSLIYNVNILFCMTYIWAGMYK